MFARFSPTKMGWNVAILILLCVIVFFHVWQLVDIPRGLYVDESSIGLNAATIAESGRDEHGVRFPVYFQAFRELNETKNPIHIYTAALFFKLFGPSEFLLRFTSFTYFYLFLIGLYFLVSDLLAKNKIVPLYALLVAGFLPWFFPLSRIAFEVITQLSFTVFSLLLIYRLYHVRQPKSDDVFALGTGLLIGVSIYTYSTARLFAPLLILLVLIIYMKRENFRKNVFLLGGFLLGLIPYILFALTHQGALTARLKDLSYLQNPALGLTERVTLYLQHYGSYFRPDFLLFHGDLNTRHAIGVGGQIFTSVFILAVIGIIWIIRTKQYNHRFIILLLLCFLASPTAAALTAGPPHALRSVLLGFYFLILSCYGLNALLGQSKLKITAIAGLTIFLGFETVTYLAYYFNDYPKQSVGAFESYNIKEALALAIGQSPQDIIVSSQANNPYAHLEFYRRLVANPQEIPVRIDQPIAETNRCIIYFAFDETILNTDELRSINLSPADSFTKLRCYQAGKIHDR